MKCACQTNLAIKSFHHLCVGCIEKVEKEEEGEKKEKKGEEEEAFLTENVEGNKVHRVTYPRLLLRLLLLLLLHALPPVSPGE